MKNNEDLLSILINKWKPHIIVHGSSFMLPPQKVFPFVEDLIKANELFVGCDGWRYVDRSKNWIVQDLGINFSVEEYFSWDEMTPEKNLELLPSFLNDLPENIDLISVDLNDPEVTARIIEEISK